MEEHDLEQELRSCEQKVAEHPDDPEAHMNLGTALAHAGRHAEAEQACATALRLRPDYYEAEILRGWSLGSLGKPAEALACLDHAAELAPDAPAAHVHRGYALNRLERFEEALAAFERAAALGPLDAHALQSKAWTLRQLGRDADSPALMVKAFELLPDTPENAKTRAEILGSFVKSVRELQLADAQALEAELVRTPDNVIARVQLATYWAQQSLPTAPHESSTARAKAKEHAVWLIRNHPRLCSIEVTAYLSPISHGSEQIRDTWMQAVQAAPEDVIVLANAAQHFQYKDSARAAELYRRLRALEPLKARWADRLAETEFDHLVVRFGDSAKIAERGRRALAILDEAMLLPDAGKQRTERFAKIAFCALAAGELDRSHQAAVELLQSESPPEAMQAYAHLAHVVLGRIALRRNDVEAAREELRAAGRTAWLRGIHPGEPSMDLADELLERGEREAVSEYLQVLLDGVQELPRPKNTWHVDQWIDKLIGWKALLQAGRKPDLHRAF